MIIEYFEMEVDGVTVFQPLARDLKGELAGTCQMADDDADVFVRTLFVRPEYRRQKVARTLLQWCYAKAKSRGKRMLFLYCKKDNHPGNALYDSVGFAKMDSEEDPENYIRSIIVNPDPEMERIITAS